MLIVLPHPTSVEMTPIHVSEPTSTPVFQKEAETIVNVLKDYSVHELSEKFQISQEAASEAYEEYQHYDDPEYPRKPAIFAFDDLLFRSIKPSFFTPADYHYAQQNTRIVSSLYGLLRPMDLIKECRTSFSLKLSKLNSGDLCSVWRPLIKKQLEKDARKMGGEILYLAGDESMNMTGIASLSTKFRVIVARFKDWKDNKWKEFREFEDPAMAALSNWIIKNKIQNIADIKNWRWKGYRFNSEESDELHWCFTRTSE